MSTQQPSARNVVVLGAGIHGASVAYYLTSKFGIMPTIIERSEVAAAASGKSGGFLAREWGSGPTTKLHQLSFDMHEELARTLNVESYRRIPTINVNGNRKGKSDASWLDRTCQTSIMDGATAQVTPLELTNKLIEASVQKGARFVKGTVNGVDVEAGKVKAVKLKGQDSIPVDQLVVCLGPWSGVMCEDWFDMELPMEGIKSTSLVYRDLEVIRKEPYACFCAEDANGCHLELYPRCVFEYHSAVRGLCQH
jgi:glycine/D-amino acid oxidase-like deaminating enzyme